jgi:hypothetical protein
LGFIHCWACGHTYQSSKSSWADDATWATPQPHCWPTRVELGSSPSPPLRRAGSDRRSQTRPGRGAVEGKWSTGAPHMLGVLRRAALAAASSPAAGLRQVRPIPTLQGACFCLRLAAFLPRPALVWLISDVVCPSYILRTQKRVALILNLWLGRGRCCSVFTKPFE